MGRVKSLKFKRERILKQSKNKDYYIINLSNNGKRKNKLVHRLVHEAHIGKLEDGYDAHHINEDKKNNFVENLKMIPESEHHSLHSKEKNHPLFGKHHSEKTKRKMSESRKGRFKSEKHKKKLSENHTDFKGENNPSHKLTEDQVIQIKLLLREGILTQQEIANMFGVSQSVISDIKHGRKWPHIKVD